MINKQLEELYKYYEFSKETLSSYQNEYEMGRRTLLDLLSAQNDLINSKNQIINAETDMLFAKFRILDAMGLLVSSIIDQEEYQKLIAPINSPFKINEEKVAIKTDLDNDKIEDISDICDNSKLNTKVNKNGCSQINEDFYFTKTVDKRFDSFDMKENKSEK